MIPVRYKIFAATLPFMLLIGLLAYVNLWSMNTIGKLSKQFTEEALPRVQALSDIKTGSLRVALNIADFQAIAAPPLPLETTEVGKVKYDLLASLEEMNSGKDRYARLTDPHDSARAVFVADLSKIQGYIIDTALELADLKETMGSNERLQTASAKLIQNQTKLSSLIQNQLAQDAIWLSASQKRNEATFHQIRYAAWGSVIAALLIAGGIVLFAGKLKDAYDALEQKNAHIEQTNVALRDEIVDHERVEEALCQSKSEVEAANKELETFSYSVAHDLRAPLRGIHGLSQMLIEDSADRFTPDGKRMLGQIRTTAQQMGNLIDDLLDFSRMTRSEFKIDPVDMSALARTVFATLQSATPARVVEVVVQHGLIVDADPRLLSILLTNLLGNAWKFTSKREAARIEFSAMPGVLPTVYLVRDNGAGFDSRYKDKLFGVFQRLHTVDEFDGTGIGLATVQRIVHRHGGKVWAESEVGQGATFYFTLNKFLQT